MSGNRYSEHAMQLEAILRNRIAQLSILAAENARLKQKERALQSCILGIEGSVAATMAVLAVAAGTASHAAAGGDADTLNSGEADSHSTASGDALGTAAGASGAKHSSGSASSAAQAVLQALEAKEQQVQAVLAQLGCCGSSYSELYSARLLRRATADPAHALSIVDMSRPERLQFLVRMVQKMALLLPKYDGNAASTSLGSAREQLHAVVDELSERILVAGLLDPPAKKLGNMLTNLETMEFEPYPEGYWRSVAQSLQLSDDQKAALKMCWARVKVNKAALTEEHSKLSERLQLLQLRQHQVQLKFEEQAAQLHDLQHRYGMQQRRRVRESILQQQQQQQHYHHHHHQKQSQQEVQQSPAGRQPQQTPTAIMPQLVEAVLQLHAMPPEVQQVQQHYQQQVYIPVLTNNSQRSADGALQQVQQLVAMQQSSGLLSRGTDSRVTSSCSNPARGVQWGKQQVLSSTAIPAISAAAAVAVSASPAAAAAVMPASPWLPAGGCNMSGAVTVSPEVSGDLTDMPDETSRSSFGSALSNPEGMLLPVSCKEQRDIEQQLALITEKMKMQHFCQALQFHNTLTYKQMAEVYVNAWPFVPDALSVCEALDELNW